MSVYTDKDYEGRGDYIRSLAENYGLPYSTVFALADLLGPDEDFDGLITTLEDYTE